MYTEEKLLEKVKQDFETKYSGQEVTVSCAQLGDGSGETWIEHFPQGLRVRISDKLNPDHDINVYPGEQLIDTFFNAEATDPLPSGHYVSWIDGPTYHYDGRIYQPSIMTETEKPAPDGTGRCV